MKYLVQYKMWGNEIPYFIDDAGYWAIDSKYIGITKDSTNCYIPKLASESGDLIDFSNQDFIDYLVAMDLKNEAGEVLSEQEKTAIAEAWLTEKGF